MKYTWLTSIAALSLSAAVNAETPSIDELYKTIQKQQAEIESLQQSSSQQEERLNLTADSLANNTGSSSATTLGGYAELHYNNLGNEGDSGSIDDKTEMDFHRFVLFVGHEFNDTTRFFSEVELEHSIAGDGKAGEIELEQAYLEHDLSNTQQMKAGLFLIPVGIINETHEPNTFYGVERNPVEKNIIPATWWEGGIAFNGQLGAGFSYDIALTSGLNIETVAGDYKIRDGRQKVSKAAAEDLATTARIKYTGVKGLEVGLTAQQQPDLTQGESSEKIAATLVETHVAYQVQGFGLRALYATWDIDEEMNSVKAGAAEQSGWYIEPSYRINDQWGIFLRASEWDNQADTKNETAMAQTDIGVNYWLNANVAFKFDVQDQSPEADGAKELDGFNLGLAISF